MPIQDMNLHSATSIGGNNTTAPIYWRSHIHILNRHGGSNLHGITYLKIQLDAPIYWRCKSREQHFLSALPICRDNAY
jgi:hypothetical protein